MHNYTVFKAVHEDRMRELTGKADLSRLAAIAKQGQTPRHPGALLRGWLSLGLSRLSLEARHSRPTAKPAALDSGAATVLPEPSTGQR